MARLCLCFGPQFGTKAVATKTFTALPTHNSLRIVRSQACHPNDSRQALRLTLPPASCPCPPPATALCLHPHVGFGKWCVLHSFAFVLPLAPLPAAPAPCSPSLSPEGGRAGYPAGVVKVDGNTLWQHRYSAGQHSSTACDTLRTHYEVGAIPPRLRSPSFRPLPLPRHLQPLLCWALPSR